MSRRGLPQTVRMRHDEHYVEALTASAGTPVGRMVPIDLIDPNPNQPRQVMGDLSELMASIAEKGHHRAAGAPAARRAIPDHRGRTSLPGGRAGRAEGTSRRHSRGGRHRDHGDRLGRESPAQGSHPLRGGRGAPGSRDQLRLHARDAGATAGEVPHSHYGIALAAGNAGRGQKPLSAGRHCI